MLPSPVALPRERAKKSNELEMNVDLYQPVLIKEEPGRKSSNWESGNGWMSFFSSELNFECFVYATYQHNLTAEIYLCTLY